ncbi:MAG: hypothetical protein K2N14_01325 [Clostridia bacterium]|nr:hypothetical protein [Clostridia bacterium]
MKKLSLKNMVLGSLCLVLSVITLCGLAFDLTNVNGKYGKYIENGFMLLDFKSFFITSSYEAAAIVLAIVNWLHLLACLICVSLIIVAYFKFTQRLRNANIYTLIINGIFSVLYMIEGIVYTIVNQQTYGETFSTLSFIPLIFAVCVIVAFVIIKIKLKDKEIVIGKKENSEAPTIVNDAEETCGDSAIVKSEEDLK